MTTVPQSSSCCGCCKSQPDSPITPTLLTPIGTTGGDCAPPATATTVSHTMQQTSASTAARHSILVADTSLDTLINDAIMESIAGGAMSPPNTGGDIAPPATSDVSHVNSDDTAPTDANAHAEKVRCITRAIFWLYFKLKRNKKHTTTP